MRKVVAYTLLSVDGVAESPELFVEDFDAEMDAHLAAVIRTQDEVLLGRRMHDEWAHFWPTADIEPFAGFINTVPKYVATSTPLHDSWSGARAIHGPVGDFVRDLKSRDGGDIGLHGSIELTRSLLGSGLVDELRLVVAPVVAGAGRRLLVDGAGHRLQLVSGVATSSGALLLDYRVLDAS
jgi:dihydrofolate reductase